MQNLLCQQLYLHAHSVSSSRGTTRYSASTEPSMIDIELYTMPFLESIKCTLPLASNIFKSAEIDHLFAPRVASLL